MAGERRSISNVYRPSPGETAILHNHPHFGGRFTIKEFEGAELRLEGDRGQRLVVPVTAVHSWAEGVDDRANWTIWLLRA